MSRGRPAQVVKLSRKERNALQALVRRGALYRRAPKDSVVLSIDEKTGIQAIERKHWDKPPGPARPRRQEFEYIRHGTQALTAALDVHSGRVLARCTDRRTQDDLVGFMERVARAYPRGTVHVIWDNLNTEPVLNFVCEAS